MDDYMDEYFFFKEMLRISKIIFRDLKIQYNQDYKMQIYLDPCGKKQYDKNLNQHF